MRWSSLTLLICCLFFFCAYGHEVEDLTLNGCECLPLLVTLTNGTVVPSAGSGCDGGEWCYVDPATCETFPAGDIWDTCVVIEEPAEVVPGWHYAAVFVLICCSGLFSGLTLGLLSLDKVGLEIVQSSGSPEEQKYATQIIPLRDDGNLLLCTLLLGNTAVNAALAILMEGIAGGLIGFAISTVSIVIFGEICPQSICSRYGLMVGAKTRYFVWVFMYLMMPMSKPIAMALDRLLGEDLGTIYSRNKLAKLVELHAQEIGRGGDLRSEEVKALEGVLSFGDKTASEIMTPIDDVFMLEQKTKLNFDALMHIFESGHSRIPVYSDKRENIIGMIFVKDLIVVSPEDEIPVNAILSLYGRSVLNVWADAKLSPLLQEFKSGRTHLAIVRKVVDDGPGDPYYQTIGVVTLEDVVEEIIQDEIIDETDVYVSVADHELVRGRSDVSEAMTSFFNRRRKTVSSRLNPQEVSVVQSFLEDNVSNLFGEVFLPSHDCQRLLASCVVLDFPQAPEDPSSLVVYERGIATEYATLIVMGKVEVTAGAEGFRCVLGPWHLPLLAFSALSEELCCPDFTARICEFPARLLRIRRNDYIAARKEVIQRPRRGSGNRAGAGADSSDAVEDDAPLSAVGLIKPQFRTRSNMYHKGARIPTAPQPGKPRSASLELQSLSRRTDYDDEDSPLN